MLFGLRPLLVFAGLDAYFDFRLTIKYVFFFFWDRWHLTWIRQLNQAAPDRVLWGTKRQVPLPLRMYAAKIARVADSDGVITLSSSYLGICLR